MNFSVPGPVTACLHTINRAGFSGYMVGGCVRDYLLHRTPADYDITTSASSEEILSLFEHVIETGVKYGTVTVLIDSMPIEVTTMRTDGDYLDHRRPQNILPASSIDEDLSRRDFTINAMAMDENLLVIDPFHGQMDLKNKRLKAVGDPKTRYEEDALRILRAFRFSAQLDFEIEAKTLSAALESAGLLKHVSKERIFAELMKTLLGKVPSKIEPLIGAGAFPFLNYNQPLKPLDALPVSRSLRFAVLCRLCGANPENVGKALKSDKKLIKRAAWFFEHLNEQVLTRYEIKKLLNSADADSVRLLFQVKSPSLLGELDNIIKSKEPISLKDLAVGGADLQAQGLKGKAIADTLDRLLDLVQKDPALNQKEILFSYL